MCCRIVRIKADACLVFVLCNVEFPLKLAHHAQKHTQVGIIRRLLYQQRKLDTRFVVPAQVLKRYRKVLPRMRVFRMLRENVAVLGFCFYILPLPTKNICKIDSGMGIFWIEKDRVFVILLCRTEIPEFLHDHGIVVVDGSILRLDPERLLKRVLCLVQSAQLVQQISKIRMELCGKRV